MVGRLFGSILLRKIKVRTAMVYCCTVAMTLLAVSLLIGGRAVCHFDVALWLF